MDSTWTEIRKAPSKPAPRDSYSVQYHETRPFPDNSRRVPWTSSDIPQAPPPTFWDREGYGKGSYQQTLPPRGPPYSNPSYSNLRTAVGVPQTRPSNYQSLGNSASRFPQNDRPRESPHHPSPYHPPHKTFHGPSQIPPHNPAHASHLASPYNPPYNPSHNPSRNPSHNPPYNPPYNPPHPAHNPSHNPAHNPAHNPSRGPPHIPTHTPAHTPAYNPPYNPPYNPSHNPTHNPSHNSVHHPVHQRDVRIAHGASETLSKPVTRQLEVPVSTDSRTMYTVIPVTRKKTSAISLMDLLTVKKGRAAKAAQSREAMPSSERAAAATATAAAVMASHSFGDKGFVVNGKKKKKKLSTIKKRVLMERLRFAAANIKSANEGDGDSAAVSAIPLAELSGYNVLLINGFVDKADMEDEDECLEVMQNIKTMFGVFGSITDIRLGGAAPGASEQELLRVADEDEVPLYVIFESFAEARMACQGATGLVVAGRTISTSVVRHDNFASQLPAELVAPLRQVLPHHQTNLAQGRGVVIIHNLIEEGDVDDEDERAELLDDVVALSSSCATVGAVVITKVSGESMSPTLLHESVEPYDVVMKFVSESIASSVVAKLDGLVVAGSPLRAALVPQDLHGISAVIVRGYACEEDCEDMLEEGGDLMSFTSMKADLLRLGLQGLDYDDAVKSAVSLTVIGLSNAVDPFAGPRSSSRYSIVVQVQSPREAVALMLRLDGSLVGGKRLSALTVPSTTKAALSNQLGYDSRVLEDGASALAVSVIDRRLFLSSNASAGELSPASDGSGNGTSQSKYKLAVDAPKLDKHVVGILPIPTASEETEVLVKEMLSKLVVFQNRAKEKDPIKAKHKQRFVVGLKQSMNGIKADRARLVLLSPDTECSAELDDRMDALLAEANSREIPMMYCLNRRKMAKALSMNTRQSVVAIYDPSGAYEEFKKLLQFVSITRPVIIPTQGQVDQADLDN